MSAGRTFIGTAGWSIPRVSGGAFPGEGTHLQRYARVLTAAEINSSFYRPHAPATYARWAASVPEEFRFSVKMPRVITHERELRRARAPLEQFLGEAGGLGDRLGAILVQLPPSLAFDSRSAGRFFDLLRRLHTGAVVCEPRHATWLTPAAEALLARVQVGRVGADPPPAPGAGRPGGWPGLVYFRMHGSPRKYWSRYDRGTVDTLAAALTAAAGDRWCIFDNTASGAAIENALEVRRLSGALA